MQTFFLHLAVSLSIGFLAGVERQMSSNYTKKDIGARDFLLVALLGFLSTSVLPNPMLSFFAFFALIAVISFMSFYFYNSKFSDKKVGGFTTFFTMPVVFVLSSLPGLGVEVWKIFIFLGILIFTLKLKDEWEVFVKTLQDRDVIDFILFILILFVVTPLIPANLEWVFSFYTLNVLFVWKIVSLISMLSFFSHFFTKYAKGKRAILITSFFGGLVSSLATVYLITKNAKKEKTEFGSVYSVFILSGVGSLVRDLVIIYSIVSFAAFKLVFLPAMLTLFFLLTIVLFTFKSVENKSAKFTSSAVPLKTILEFVVVFFGIIFCSALIRFYLPDSFFYFSNFISGIISSSASVVSSGNLFDQGLINIDHLGFAFVVAILGSMFARVILVMKYFPRKAHVLIASFLLVAMTMGFGIYLSLFQL